MIQRLKNILQREGIYVQRFQTPEAFYEYVKNENVAVQFFEIKRIGRSVREANNHYFYNGLLQLFVPNWNAEIKHSKFIEKGCGIGNVNIYRKVFIEEDLMFEKVFYSHSASLKRLFLLDKVAEKLREKGIKIPRCRYLYKGDVLTIVYYDFHDGTVVPEKDFQVEAAKISNILYYIPVNIIGEIIPEYLFNYKKYSHYFSIEKENMAFSIFEKETVCYRKIEKKIEAGRWVLTHGNLKYGHLYTNGMLIDWDESGIYPAGLEQANTFVETVMSNHIIRQHPIHWLHKYYYAIVPKQEWRLFELSFLYFLFIFSIHDLLRPENKNVKQYIIEKIKCYEL